jgi:hypothetical protein
VELMGKEKGYKSSHVYCQAKAWFKKELRKLSQWFGKEFLKWYDGGGENGITSKRIFEVEVFFPSQNIDFPFYLKRLLELLFSPFLYVLHLLSTRGFWWYLRRKSLLQKLLFKWLDMELCTPIWLNHDYGDGGVVDISVVDTYSGVEVCTPLFLGDASKYFFSR